MPNETQEVRIAASGVAAGLAGLACTAAAALTAESLVLRADLVLSLVDTLALAAVWLAVRTGPPIDRARREDLARTLVAFAMLCAMASVAAVALARLAAGGSVPHGPGVALGLAINGAQAAVNAAILLAWRRRLASGTSRLARDQLCLYGDKLASNLLIVVALASGLAFAGADWAPWIDPAASLIMAAVSAACALPVLARCRAAAA